MLEFGSHVLEVNGMNRQIVIAVSLFLVSLGYAAAAAAETGQSRNYVLIGANGWGADVSGTAYNTNSTPSTPETHIDLNSDLGLGRKTSPVFLVDIHHSVPILPDFLVEYDHVVSNGSNLDNRQITFNGVTYIANGELISQAVLEQARVLFYWNPLDNSVVDLRAGFGARWINLHLSIAGTVQVTDPEGGTQTEPGSTRDGGVRWLPMLNLGVIFHLPAGFGLFGDASYISYASSYYFDAAAGLSVRFPFGMVLDGGYRRLKLRLNNTNMSVNGDIDFEGPYAGLAWAF